MYYFCFSSRLKCSVVLFVSLTLVGVIPVNSQGYLKAAGSRIVNAGGEEVILRGIGLGGWMLQEPYMLQLAGVASAQHDIVRKINDVVGEANTTTFYNTWLANHCRKADIDSLAAWGFNSVRLPMHYNLYTLPVEKEPVAGQHTWLQKGFDLTDSLLSWCKANKIYLILDLHAAPGAQGNDIPIADKDTSKHSLWQSEANQQKTIALWRKLAERYANEEWVGGYDLLNETNYGFSNPADKNGCAETLNEPLKKLLNDITLAIRQVDQRHIIFLEGNCWANNYKGLLPFNDKNAVVSFHKYWNYNDLSSIQGFINIRQQYNMPVWLGESGENSNAWFTDAIKLLEENKIGWAWWPLKKLGSNNPLQVKTNPNYQQLVSYWRGDAPKPTEAEALKGLMQLAEDVKVENTLYRKDVIDAMFRQVNSTETKSYHPNNITKATVLNAVDYDLGRSGYAYHDADSANYRVASGKNIAWNRGRMYRNDGVDIDTCNDSFSNGYCVSHTETGEWLQYTINVSEAGVYDISFRISAKDSAGKLQLRVDEKTIGNITVPVTKDDKEWTTTTLKKVPLIKGENKLRVTILNGGFRFSCMQFQQLSRNKK